MSITQVTVTIERKTDTGAPQAGSFTFLPSTPITNGTDGRSTFPVSVTLDSTGSGSISLAASDDAGTAPTGMSYLVTEKLNGASPVSYTIVIAAAMSAGVNINSLAHYSPVPAIETYIPFQLGQNADGQVPTWDADTGEWVPQTGAGVLPFTVDDGNMVMTGEIETQGFAINGLNSGIEDGQPIEYAQFNTALDAKAPLVESVETSTGVSGAITLPDPSTDSMVHLTLSGSTTITAWTAAAGKSQTIQIEVNSETVAWSGVKWAGGTAPTLSGSSIVVLVCVDGTHVVGAPGPIAFS